MPTLLRASESDPPKSVAELRELQSTIQELSKKVVPATVAVQIGAAMGSGVIVSEDGYVMTAGHVSGKPGRKVNIILHDGKRVKGETLGANFGIDAGLIKITDEGKYPFVEKGEVKEINVGEWCVATGHPGGYQKGRTPVVRLGRVLAKRDRLLVTDCTLIGGDSGGPLFDLDGKVIGINSRIGGALSANIHVPISTFNVTWDRLAKGESWGSPGNITRGGGPPVGAPYIGVTADRAAPDAKITGVTPGSPAEKAGIQAGDIVKKFADKAIGDFASLAKLVRNKKPGDKVAIEVLRGEDTITLELTLGTYGG
ncbi:MAG: S1C family serine protease [Pirellulales bacterium]|nr:S1C family serine protease [Pirellulales bacterium]